MITFTKFIGIFSVVSILFIIHQIKRGQNQSLYQQYQLWKSNYAFHFQSLEDIYRFKIFIQNKNFILNHNHYSNTSYRLQINQFSAFTPQQFQLKYLMISPISQSNNNRNFQDIEVFQGNNIDWIQYGAFGPISNQGACSANYAFSTIQSISSLRYIVFKIKQQLSAQYILDCSKGFGNNGCLGGNAQNSLNFVLQNGISPQTRYPYTGRQQQCIEAHTIYSISAVLSVTNSCNGLANILSIQPVIVSVDGSNFQFYKSGIFNNCGNSKNLDVLLVGMTDEYWKVRLSWGITWGQMGYMRIYKGNTCGICNSGFYPIL